MKPLSIIVPTADRADYAVSVVEFIVSICPQAEIIVSDTGKDESLLARLTAPIAAGQVIYLRPGIGIDVVSNFEAARVAASGDYLMFLGDDDCIGPNVMDIVAWARDHAIDAVVPYADYFLALYYWPGVTSRYFGASTTATLFVKPFDGGTVAINPREALRAALRRFGGGLGAMPRAYHGLVSRALVDRIVAQHGCLFGGVSPDIFSATLIAMTAERVAQVDWPFCIPGASPRSTAGLGAARADRSSLWTNPHILPFKKLVWDPLIPEFYSPTTVWAYSFKRAVDRFPGNGLRPNLDLLYAHSLVFNRGFASPTVTAWRNSIPGRGILAASIGLILAIVGTMATLSFKVIGRVGSFKLGGRNTRAIGDLADIGQAYRALEREIASKGVSLRLTTFR